MKVGDVLTGTECLKMDRYCKNTQVAGWDIGKSTFEYLSAEIKDRESKKLRLEGEIGEIKDVMEKLENHLEKLKD